MCYFFHPVALYITVDAEWDRKLSANCQCAVRSKAAERATHALVWNKQNELSLDKGPFVGGEKHRQLFLF